MSLKYFIDPSFHPLLQPPHRPKPNPNPNPNPNSNPHTVRPNSLNPQRRSGVGLQLSLTQGQMFLRIADIYAEKLKADAVDDEIGKGAPPPNKR